MLSLETLNAVAGAVNTAHHDLVNACLALARGGAESTDPELFHTLMVFRHRLALLEDSLMKRIAVESGEAKLTGAAVEVRP